MTYPGGKAGAGVFQTIINQIPPHRVYVEAFCGSAAVWRHKRPAELSYLIDIDPAVTSVMGQVATDPQGDNAVGGPRLVRLASSNGLSADVRPKLASAERVNSSDGVLQRQGSRETPVTIGVCADAISWLRGLQKRLAERRNEGAHEYFIYCDPPYLGTVRRAGPARRVYRYEMMGDEAIGETEHRELLTVLLALPCPAMVSGYQSPLYGQMLASWRRLDYQAMTRGGTPATESLWMNYAEPDELHDYRYLGRNFRERQDFKRMRARWLARLEAMPRLKRMALMSALSVTGIDHEVGEGAQTKPEQHRDEGHGPDGDEPIEDPERA